MALRYSASTPANYLLDENNRLVQTTPDEYLRLQSGTTIAPPAPTTQPRSGLRGMLGLKQGTGYAPAPIAPPAPTQTSGGLVEQRLGGTSTIYSGTGVYNFGGQNYSSEAAKLLGIQGTSYTGTS